MLLSRGEAQFGPYSTGEIETFVAEGRLLPTDLCWYEGLPAWVPLSTLLTDAPAPS